MTTATDYYSAVTDYYSPTRVNSFQTDPIQSRQITLLTQVTFEDLLWFISSIKRQTQKTEASPIFKV